MTTRTKTLIQHIAGALEARANCARSGNVEWLQRHSERLNQLARFLPSGSGINNGTTIELDASNGGKIVLRTSFHHMDEYGSYDGWSEHVVTVRPAFDGIDIAISGRNRNDIKDYLRDTFYQSLTTTIAEDEHGYRLAS